MSGNSNMETSSYYYGRAFDGSDVKVFATDSKGEKIELADSQALSVIVQTQFIPRYIMGKAHPVSLTKGKRMISGTISFAVINESAIEKLRSFKKEGQSNEVTNPFDSNTVLYKNNLNYLDQLPELDIVIVAEADGIKATKTIRGVSFFNEKEAIGLNTIGSVSQTQFLAKEITPLEIVG